MAPETLILTTSGEFGGDDVLVERAVFGGGAIGFLQVTTNDGPLEGTGTAFLTAAECIALADQLMSIVAASVAR